MIQSLRNYLFGAFLAILLAGSAAGISSLSPPVFLPNGEEFKTWEEPVKFSHTYYVDQKNPNASDDNPGTENLPFRTINRAAQVLKAGERVVVSAGVYRERVSPARGGKEPNNMISYEAAPGEEVIISGSRILPMKWVTSRCEGKNSADGAWMTVLLNEWFKEENPFAEINLTDEQIDRCMDWAIPIKGKPPITLRRGLVFQDGQRLKQVAEYDELSKSAGTYWMEPNSLTLHLRPFGDVNPNHVQFEMTVLGSIFAPRDYGLGYIRVKGFTMEHSGNCFPRLQEGALSTRRGHHWIIEDNIVRQCNAIGIDIGDQFRLTGPKLAEGGQHIVRRNRVSDCGIGGIEGVAIEHTLIEDNIIRRCGWQNIWRLYETGGIKVHVTRSCVLRRNLITDTISAPGIWMDFLNVNSRCTANIIVNVQCGSGAIIMEASQKPNMVDNNFIWGTQGAGIFQNDCDELLIAHNLVAYSTGNAVRTLIIKNRFVGGRLTTARRNRIINNVFINNADMPAISDSNNTSDYNLFANLQKPFDLSQWQAKGWDKHSVTAQIAANFNPGKMEFSWTSSETLPKFPGIKYVTFDIIGQMRKGRTVLPGPFAVNPDMPLQLRHAQ